MKTCLFVALLLATEASASHPVLSTLPRVDDEELQQIFADDWTLWYDDSTMPPAMQFGANADPAHVHHGHHRFNNIDRTTNPNLEYPWRVGGGMHQVNPDSIQVVKFFWHPLHKPVVYYPTIRSSVFYQQRAWDWVFPIDSVVGEIIALKRNGATYPCEIRMLRRDADAWIPRVLRQWNDTEQLADKLWDMGQHELAVEVGNTEEQSMRLVDTTHPTPAVEFSYQVAMIPTLPEQVVDQLLDEPLKEVAWPLTIKSNQLFPAGYGGAQVGIGRDDCLKCHNHVAKHANNFDRPGRDWYGYVRGSDRIFTFHPFAHSSISVNGGDLPVQFNRTLLQSGHISQYNRQPGYTRLP